MEAETGAERDTEIDAPDELALEIAGDEEEAPSVSEPGGGNLSILCSQLLSVGFHFCLSFA